MRDLIFKYLAKGKGATVSARFGPDGTTIGDPDLASDGVSAVFLRTYETTF